jgi:hypothetical protein
MKPKRFAPGIFVVGPLGELAAEEWVRQRYLKRGLTPPPPLPSRPRFQPSATRLTDEATPTTTTTTTTSVVV